MQVQYSTSFVREFKKLTSEKKEQAIKAEKLFIKNPFAKQLKTHKLTGRLGSLWAFSINRKDRIVFEFLEEKVVVFYRVGNHDIYK